MISLLLKAPEPSLPLANGRGYVFFCFLIPHGYLRRALPDLIWQLRSRRADSKGARPQM